jgi:UDP-N-acetylglucosamine--N-acetylmuramyl-(pentapeptide) pyrophosphoryl-undecaprenol N-acetylglucosamine transferase
VERGGALLVASAGGHLQQLHQLVSRFELGTPRTWVTYDVPQARTLLQGERVIPAHHPTTKNAVNAARNLRLARAVMNAVAPTVVLSTGAGVAVPFCAIAARRGIPTHYIESATRAVGPSLSGRMLQSVRGVCRYRQLGQWGGEKGWAQGPSVFDGFDTRPAPALPRLERVLVSLGTHDYPFDGLVERLQAILPTAELTWQLGSTEPSSNLGGRIVRHLPAQELAKVAQEADVVVGHAGVGLALTALNAGHVPVLVPRRRARKEHTDDHQVQLAGALAGRGLAVCSELGELHRGHLDEALRRGVTREEPPPFDLRCWRT